MLLGHFGLFSLLLFFGRHGFWLPESVTYETVTGSAGALDGHGPQRHRQARQEVSGRVIGVSRKTRLRRATNARGLGATWLSFRVGIGLR